MRRTLFFIPHEVAGIPVFGFGLALGLLGLVFVMRLAWAARQRSVFESASASRPGTQPAPHQPPTVAQVFVHEGFIWASAAAIIVAVLPGVELENADGQPVGMAIRGYGVMLLLGVVSAVLLAAYRAKRAGMNPDLIFELAPWVFVGGIAGARLFYVIQYYDHFVGATTWETVKNMLAFTEGGLVVYGSFIGGFLAFALFTVRRHLPILRFGDVIVPALFLGVFFGRIGCLLNGCCYGGRCEPDWASLRFPPITKVYQEQLSSGELLGMTIDPSTGIIESVAPESTAAELGIQPGDLYQGGEFDRRPLETAPETVPAEDVQRGWIMRVSGKTHVLSPEQLPAAALPVRAAQPISSVSSLILCLALCFASLFIRREGALMFLGFASYAVLRFVLEIVRVDEAGQFNTTLSISQWVSLVVFGISIVGLIWVAKRGTSSAATA
ncbi:prolipoprotein diacylglyceryl transferase [Roseiconus nitratireducens]|uniref:Phosphatidylglycerol--prolipoprotein diacylglyceryl transferase n=1 Tax=Roseiconus nitratireducens TaxID=2605748 RepID=A0A5M6D8L5_9BACT|nr:prolipoprotein diacylglyceryl transferase family protein [Roseiconus nitratireducens]KAA5543874.1 prolipoprotein diacylglyceryl transferase [Roseiconus nitratireducens]